MEQTKQPIVFAYWKDDEFKGFRADTWNTLSNTQPKIYIYSKDQVEIVLANVRGGCNRVGSALFRKIVATPGLVAITAEGETVQSPVEIQLSNTEQMFRDWKEFEVRVHPFVPAEEFYSLGHGDEWKKAKILVELEPAIEVHKFKIVENEN